MRLEDPHGRTGEEEERETAPSLAEDEARTRLDLPLTPEVQPPYPTIYSAPRRFDLATMLAVTVAYALLFTVMQVLRAPPYIFALNAGFFTAVAIGQALLFGGKSPRKASILVGAVYWPSAVLLQFGWHPCAAAASAVQGGLLGYVAGTLVGGVFLVADAVKRAY